MEVSRVQTTSPPAETHAVERRDESRDKKQEVAQQRAADVKISNEARRLAEQRAESGAEHAREARERIEDQGTRRRGTLAVRFGPAPVRLNPPVEASAANVVRQGLDNRAMLPRVGDLLTLGQPVAEPATSASSAGDAPHAAELHLSGSRTAEERPDLVVIGDGAREGNASPSDKARSDGSPDGRAEHAALDDLLRPRQRVAPAPELPGSSRSTETQHVATGQARAGAETADLQRADAPSDLEAVTATAPISGAGAQSAGAEARAELAGSQADRAIDREQLARNAMTLGNVVEATQRDELTSHYLGRTSADDAGPVPQTKHVLGERP